MPLRIVKKRSNGEIAYGGRAALLPKVMKAAANDQMCD